MIRIQNLKKSYGPKHILDEVTFHFPEGERIALVGANGAGKTTLLNILCGLEDSDGGKIIAPSSMTLGYLPQEPNPKPEPTLLAECLAGAKRFQELKGRLDSALARMTADYSESSHTAFERAEADYRDGGGYAVEAKAKGILTGLGFNQDSFEKHPQALSGGWRMRLELAKIFLNDPDFLILDEPTNHLDLPSLVWVERYLQTFPGTLLFVSHDRDLLNRLATLTLHLHRGRLEPYKGNFDQFLEARELKLESDTARAETLRKKREAMERFAERFGAKATKAKQAQSKLRMASRLKDLEDELVSPDNEDTLVLRLPKPTPSGREVYKVDKGVIGYGSTVLSKNVSLNVQRGNRIAIIGANGIGKSTLLKSIAGHVPPLGGSFSEGHNVSLGYFAQDQLDVLDEDSTILENVLRSSSDITEKEARNLLGSFLFQGDDAFKKISVLSGGEKSRVGLACLLVKKANFLLLDEPTNHLDMSSVEILGEALDEFEGTIAFVSHNRSFINSVCTHVFAMVQGGQCALFEGKLDDYERLANVSGFPNVLSPEFVSMEQAREKEDSASTSAKNNLAQSDALFQELKRERQRLDKHREKLEKEMAKGEASLASLEKSMLDAVSDYTLLAEAQKKHSELKAKMDSWEMEWLEVSERLEQIAVQVQEMGRS